MKEPLHPGWRSFLFSSSVYSCHLSLISSASVRSIPFLSFIVPVFAWNIPSPYLHYCNWVICISSRQPYDIEIYTIFVLVKEARTRSEIRIKKTELVPGNKRKIIARLLLLLSRFSRVRLCATPQTAAHQAPPSLGFSRQEHWSGLLFPSLMHEREKWKWSRSVVSDSSRPHGLQPTRLLRPWDFPGKSTGVGCHCFLQNYSRSMQFPIKKHIEEA